MRLSLRVMLVCVCVSIVIGALFFYNQTSPPPLSAKQLIFLNGDYSKQAKAIKDASEFLREGNFYYRKNNYEKAVTAYENAYRLDSGSRVFVALKLIDVYKKLGNNQKAIAVIDDILANRQLADVGVKRFQDIRSRLVD